MLGVLSLPLLIVGLYQLHSYRASLSDQASAIARVESESEAGALESWIESHPAQAADPQKISQADARDLYARLAHRATPGAQAAVAVFDPQGRFVAPRPGAAAPDELPAQVKEERWGDGVSRVTAATRATPSGC